MVQGVVLHTSRRVYKVTVHYLILINRQTPTILVCEKIRQSILGRTVTKTMPGFHDI